MSAASNRRNGKAASCEPCRKAKIKCDHTRPICGRCERRGLTARCYYHPAPLTKPRGSGACTAPVLSPSTTEPSPCALRIAGVTTVGRDGTAGKPAGSYGQTATSPWPLTSAEYHGRLPPPQQQEDPEAYREEKLNVAREIVSQLRHVELIQFLVRNYIAHAQAALTPRAIPLAWTDSLTGTHSLLRGDGDEVDEGKTTRLAEMLLRNTAMPIVIAPDMSVAEFIALHSGPNLRLETLGLLYALAARACKLGLTGDDDRRQDFVLAMYKAVSSCLRLSRWAAAGSNDAMLWLAFEWMRLTTHMEGDSSPICYRRIGDLSTYLFEFNIHREAGNQSIPFFLVQIRRKLFSASYQLDKFLATILDRPPRILRRYADCKMPLDLTDDQIVQTASEEQASLLVTPNGWNLQAEFSPSTWHRLRYIQSSLREEILEYEYRPSNPENDLRLRELSRELHRTHDSLPHHLQYATKSWDSGLPTPVCFMLVVLHLSYLQSDFQIHRMLEKFYPEAWERMLNVATEVVTHVLHIGTCLNRAIFLRHDFPYIVLGYGLPCAAVLTRTLQNLSRNNGALPKTISRSTLIRHLSVFVSHLETICNPDDGNHNICIEASKAISRALDEILDLPAGQNAITGIAIGPRTPFLANEPRGVQANDSAESHASHMDIDAAGTAELDILDEDGFDLSSWIRNIDWAGTGGEWSAF